MPYLEANRLEQPNTVFHVSLNPSPEDKLTDEQFREIAREYMERMGYGNQPYIVSNIRISTDSIFMSYRCASMSNGHKLPHDFEAKTFDGDTYANPGTQI